MRLTSAFIRYTYKKEDLFLDELPNQLIADYEFYIKTIRKCSHNTTVKYLKNFKKITLLAMTKGWLKTDPFAQIQFHLEKTDRDFLEKHELKKLLDKKLDIPRMARVRDIFCLLPDWVGLYERTAAETRTYRFRHKRDAMVSQTAPEDREHV